MSFYQIPYDLKNTLEPVIFYSRLCFEFELPTPPPSRKICIPPRKFFGDFNSAR